LSQQVAEAIRHMILVGRLAPGEVVTQDRLAELLSVSTMPVREALLRLSHEGFVEARPNRSFQVAHTSREDIEDVYRTHAFLAGELTARAARRGTPSLINDLQAIQKEWIAADTESLERLNWRFHRAINRAASSPKLLLFLRNTIRFIPEHFYVLLPEWRDLSSRGHCGIAKAITLHDPERARVVAERHVRDAGRLLVAHFDDTGYWSVPR
jgi:DNA-binding GntR family transcriptional regulator